MIGLKIDSCRDRIGVKPLFYFKKEITLHFASNKIYIAIGNKKPPISTKGISHFIFWFCSIAIYDL